MFAFGVSPIFAQKASGAYFWDIDGNKYLDTQMSVGAVLLGYSDPDVDQAFREQQEMGTIFSLLHPVEVELAKLLVEVIPCAEMVRFGKSGGEANTVAVRIARAFTGRDKVAFCGYHGWHDWYLAANLADPTFLEKYLMPDVEPRGIPRVLTGTALPFDYNDIDSLERLFLENKGEIACVIMEASRTFLPQSDFLEAVCSLTHKHGALLIFDEVVTGFRLALGGAQERHGVVPDLATFGKTIANGYPLTAIVGRRDVMELSRELFISSTFWDDNCSLAAGVATVTKMRKTHLSQQLEKRGTRYMKEWTQLAERIGVPATLVGSAAAPGIAFEARGAVTTRQLNTLYIQEMGFRGVFPGTAFSLCLAHGDPEIDFVLNAAEDSLKVVKKALDEGDAKKYLIAEEQRPLFKRRMV
jgi:glutamate-1-semialdehyde 2,1-aminomutase